MLKPECATCDNQENCSYLALANCAHCPLVLVCPAQQMADGFNVCVEPGKIARSLLPMCLLPVKFFRAEDEALTKATSGVEGHQVSVYCGRCGGKAKTALTFDTDYVDEGLDIFGEMKVEKTAEHLCTICQLRAKVAGEAPLRSGSPQSHAVFQVN